jgi:hypothetical protein
MVILVSAIANLSERFVPYIYCISECRSSLNIAGFNQALYMYTLLNSAWWYMQAQWIGRHSVGNQTSVSDALE